MRHWLAIGMFVANGILVGAVVAACGGDDTVGALPDAGRSDASGGTVDASAPVMGDDAAAEAGACTLFDAGALDDAAVQRGLALVKAYKCQQCHGQLLSGNKNGVPSPFGGLAYPPNLTSDPETGLGCWTTQEIERAILQGIDDQGVALCAPMPRFADAGLDASGAVDIATFLRSLAPQMNQVPQTSCGAGDGGEGDGGAGDGGTGEGGARDGGDGGASDADASDDAADAASD